MMSEKKIKVGDRVRFIGGSGPWFEHQITSGDEGVVTGKGICDDGVCVSFPIADVVDISDLQVIESTDPRAAFLQELKELLGRYNARVRWSMGTRYEDKMLVSANIEVHTPQFNVYFSGENGLTLSADNIMDYKNER